MPRGGLHGVGLAVVNALSERLVVETTYASARWMQTFERGERATVLRRLGVSTRPGTTIRFRPDPDIFGAIELDHTRVRERLCVLARLHPHLRVWFQEQRLLFRGGVREWARELARERGEVVESALLFHSVRGFQVELALAWNREGPPLVRSFVNLHEQVGGSHIDGLWRGFVDYARAREAPARRDAHVREAVGVGLVAIANVHMAEPHYRSQTRDFMTNPDAALAMRKAMLDGLSPDGWQAWAVRRFLDERLHVKR
jgi:DNA gyrase subunit B